jgi:peptidyl-prolyl cis-trans isomerase SurA
MKKTKIGKIGKLVVLGAALVGTPTVASARVVEKIAAVVGDDIILQSEIEERAQPIMSEIAAIADANQRSARASAVRREILERLIDEQLLVQQASDLKLNVSSEEIDRSIEEIKKTNSINDTQLRDELRKMGMSMNAYRQNTKKEILKFRVVQIAVGSKVTISDKDVQDYYDRHFKSGNNAQVRASTIFVAIPDDADNATVVEREKLAKQLLAQASAGAEFAKLAKEHSQDPATRGEGGDLGYFGKDILPKPIEELVFSMKVGEVRGPVRVDRGFHVLKLTDRRTVEAKPLDQMKDDIRRQLHAKEMERQTKNFLSELRRKTLVDVRL